MAVEVDRLDLRPDETYRRLRDSGGLNARRTDEKYGDSKLPLGCDVDVEWFGEADPGVIGAHSPLMANVGIREFLETVSAIPTNRP
jgi:hypothetical protein